MSRGAASVLRPGLPPCNSTDGAWQSSSQVPPGLAQNALTLSLNFLTCEMGCELETRARETFGPTKHKGQGNQGLGAPGQMRRRGQV